ncbi:MAG: PQQ-binding-like beta-propeller repeat protein [Pirellulales bacterium]|nr:PQQ-binding-like beta-propeller repeat protein [Pirellulales bacterium]
MGPNRDAVWNETEITRSFPEDGPPVKWRIPIGTGYAGPAVAEGRVYLMDRKQEMDDDGRPKINRDVKPPAFLGTERVFCVSAETGELIWEHEYDCPYQIQYQNGPRTTPLIENGRCYVLGAMGDLFCFDANNGDVLWHRNFPQEYGAKPPFWGWSNHPVIDGDHLYCTVGGEGSAVVAFDKNSGEELWKALTAEEIGYAPPVIYQADGNKQLIAWLDTSVESLDPLTGKGNWSMPFPERGAPQRPVVTIMTPLFINSHLYVSNFYNGSLMCDVAADGSDATKVWGAAANDGNHKQGLNILMMTPFAMDGYLYGAAGMGQFRCINAKTGEVAWRDISPLSERRPAAFATCFLVRNGDAFFIFNDSGDLIIADLSPEGYKELARAKLLEPDGFARGRNVVWSHPAYADKKFFGRNESELICVDLAAEANQSK